MDYIDTLLIMEDDLDENQEDGDLGNFRKSWDDNNDSPEQDSSREPTGDSTNNSTVSTPYWCVCGRCRQMPQEVEMHKTYFAFYQVVF